MSHSSFGAGANQTTTKVVVILKFLAEKHEVLMLGCRTFLLGNCYFDGSPCCHGLDVDEEDSVGR